MIGKKYFLNVSKGRFFEKDIPGQQAQHFFEITGHLVNITFKILEKGEVMRLHVIDEMNFYLLSMLLHSRAAKAFFRIVKNCDLHHEMTFRMNDSGGKDFFSIVQFSSVVPWYYNCCRSGRELPSNESDYKDFFIRMIKEEIVPGLQKKMNPYPNHFFYKPSFKGLQGGYFSNESTSVGLKGGTKREFTDPGFGKAINIR